MVHQPVFLEYLRSEVLRVYAKRAGKRPRIFQRHPRLRRYALFPNHALDFAGQTLFAGRVHRELGEVGVIVRVYRSTERFRFRRRHDLTRDLADIRRLVLPSPPIRPAVIPSPVPPLAGSISTSSPNAFASFWKTFGTIRS